MRFTYKKTTEIKQSGNTLNNKILRKEFCAFLLEFMNKHYIIIFLDECSFNLQYHPSYAWAERNKRATEIIRSKSNNYSVLAFFYFGGIMAFSITRGGLDAQTFSSLFNEFYEHYQHSYQKEKIIFILDNAKIHSANFTNLTILERFIVKFLPPYSPQLNPIEYCFKKWKFLVKKERPFNESLLVKSIINAAKQISFKDGLGFYLKLCENMKGAYLLKDLE